MKQTFCVTLCALCVFAAIGALPVSVARGDVLLGIGAIGAESSSGGPTQYAAVLQDHRGLNFGGAGVPYAYGHVGADSASVLLPGNQVDQVVAQITATNISLANFFIGNNDYIDAGDDIATGALSGAPLAAFQAQVEANIETAVGAVQAAGGSVVLGGFTNLVHSPAAASIKANPVARARLENAMADGEAVMAAFANSQGIPFIDFFGLLSAVYDSGIAQIGGVDLILDGFDDSDPHYFWEDPFHPGPLINGAIANLFLQAINEGSGTSFPLLSDEEILALAGLEGEYVEETFAASYAYSDYVSVPEPSALALAAIGLVVVVAFGSRRGATARVRNLIQREGRSMKLTFCVTLCTLVVFALILQGGTTPARADILDGVAAIGAGNADGDATNFPALMQDYAGLNFGGAGAPYALGGVNADSASILLPGNQVDMAVAEILAGNVSLVMLGIGDNDYIDVGDAIALGTLSGAPLAAYQQQVADNIATSVTALQSAGAGVVLGGFANIVHSPVAAAIKANPVARANLETALADGNALVKSFANSQNLSFINFFDLLSAVYAEGSAQMGGVEVILDGYGADPHYFWEDPYHAGILVRGVIANLHIQAINEAYGTNVPLLSDLDILTLAGLEDEYVVESFQATYAYNDYVTVPEPTALVLAAIGLAAVVVAGAQRGAVRREATRRSTAC